VPVERHDFECLPAVFVEAADSIRSIARPRVRAARREALLRLGDGGVVESLGDIGVHPDVRSGMPGRSAGSGSGRSPAPTAVDASHTVIAVWTVFRAYQPADIAVEEDGPVPKRVTRPIGREPYAGGPSRGELSKSQPSFPPPCGRRTRKEP